MSVDDATWGEVRRCYSRGEMSVARIAARFGVSVGAVRYRAGRDGWVRPSGRERTVRQQCGDDAGAKALKTKSKIKGKTTTGAQGRRGKSAPRRTFATRDEVVERLYQAIVMKLVSLEARMESQADGEASIDAAQSERETRELSTMIRSFEKVTEVAADIAKQSKPKSDARGEDSVDAERMRDEIAERLERLHAQRDAAGGSGGDGAE